MLAVLEVLGRRTRGRSISWRPRGGCCLGEALGTFLPPADLNFVVARGRGRRVHDAAGRGYLDYVLASGPLILGHGHPAVVEAVCE